MDINTLLEYMKEIPDSKLNQTFAGALNLTEQQQETASFAFWLCYMAESDLERIIKAAWEHSSKFFTAEVNNGSEKIIFDKLKGYRLDDADFSEVLNKIGSLGNVEKALLLNFVSGNYKPKPKFNINDLPFFADKIRVYEALFGDTKRNKLLWKINDIRNDLSHCRVDSLKYEKESLYLRATKERVIEDYFRTILEDDRSKSEIWNALTEVEKLRIQEMNKDLKI